MAGGGLCAKYCFSFKEPTTIPHVSLLSTNTLFVLPEFFPQEALHGGTGSSAVLPVTSVKIDMIAGACATVQRWHVSVSRVTHVYMQCHVVSLAQAPTGPHYRRAAEHRGAHAA